MLYKNIFCLYKKNIFFFCLFQVCIFSPIDSDLSEMREIEFAMEIIAVYA